MNIDTYFEHSKKDSIFIANLNEFNLNNTAFVLFFINSLCFFSFYMSSIFFNRISTDFLGGLTIFMSGSFIFSFCLRVLLDQIIEKKTTRHFRQMFFDTLYDNKNNCIFFFIINSIAAFIYLLFIKIQYIGLGQNNFFEVIQNEINTFSLSFCFFLCAQFLFSYFHYYEQRKESNKIFTSLKLVPIKF